jgi:hypothetical protein
MCSSMMTHSNSQLHTVEWLRLSKKTRKPHAMQATVLMYSKEVLTAHDTVARRRTEVVALPVQLNQQCAL